MAAAVILVVIGGCVAVAGAVLSVVAGPDDTMRTGYHPVTASSRALVARTVNISRGAVPSGFGEFSMRIDARSDGMPMFIGVAPAAAVEGYLAGASVRNVRGLQLWPYRLQTADTQGTASPLLPEKQSFWVASSSGTSPHLTWHVTDGEYRMVVMNTDASPGLAIEARYALTMPWLFEIGLGSLALAGVIAGAGVFLLVGNRHTES
jgi:hypothetical protein